jgi:glutaredoxin 3
MILYIKPWCPWCIDAVRWLEQRGYQFEKSDVLTDPVARARMREISGQALTPTLEIPSGEVLADFDTGQLEKFFETHRIAPR